MNDTTARVALLGADAAHIARCVLDDCDKPASELVKLGRLPALPMCEHCSEVVRAEWDRQ